MRPTRRRSVSALLLVVLALVAAACGGSDDSSSSDDGGDGGSGGSGSTATTVAMEPQDGGKISFAVEADSDGYHPIDNRWSISGNFVGSAIYEPLMAENGDGTLEPWLAESVTPNDDGTEWTIVTKEGITFHDGSPFDADVVVANIEARRENPLTSLANQPIESVEKVDDRTVLVTMNTPWSAYDHSLAAVGGYMAAPAMLGEDGDHQAVIGTGPFTFVEWVPGDRVVVERNDDYWREPAHLDEITFLFLTDVQTRTASLESGDVDAIITPDASAIRDWRTDDSIQSFEHSSEPFHVILNSVAPPLDQLEVRQAIAYATNQETVVLALGGEDVLEPATTAFVPTNPWHLEDNGFPAYDLDKATELADAYEEENGEPIRFTIKGSAGQEEALANALIEMWGAAGIEASFEALDQAAYLGDVFLGNFQAGLFRNHNWIDPDFNYIFWHSSTSKPVGELSINFTHLEVPELDAALDAGRATLDPDERRQAYDEVQRILNEQLTEVWLFNQVWALASQPDVHGWDDVVSRGLSRLEPKVFWADVWREQ